MCEPRWINAPISSARIWRGRSLALSRKGCARSGMPQDPVPEIVDRMLGGRRRLRQITIAPELPHGLQAIRSFATAGTVPAVGHCDADYETARRAFDEGAGLMTHMFNAMNGLHHRKARSDSGGGRGSARHHRADLRRLPCAGSDAAARPWFRAASHRLRHRRDGRHRLPGRRLQARRALDVDVVDGHARLKSNGAIAGSTLTLEHAVQRAVLETGHVPGRGHRGSHADPGEGLRIRPAVSGHRRTPRSARPRIRRRRLLTDPPTGPSTRAWCAGRRINNATQKKKTPAAATTLLGGFSVTTNLPKKNFLCRASAITRAASRRRGEGAEPSKSEAR